MQTQLTNQCESFAITLLQCLIVMLHLTYRLQEFKNLAVCSLQILNVYGGFEGLIIQCRGGKKTYLMGCTIYCFVILCKE